MEFQKNVTLLDTTLYHDLLIKNGLKIMIKQKKIMTTSKKKLELKQQC